MARLREVVQSMKGLGEGAACLHDKVVAGGSVRVERHGPHHLAHCFAKRPHKARSESACRW